MPAPILRTMCSVAFTTPSNTILNLPVNCAGTASIEWPSFHFKTSTTGLNPPVTEGGIGSGSSFSIAQNNVPAQSVVRGMFAYVATHPIYVTIIMQSSIYLGEDPDMTANSTYIAKLYSPNGSTVETYIDTVEATSYYGYKSVNAVLPATVCPKILWAGVATQQSEGSPELLDCSASLNVQVGPIE